MRTRRDPIAAKPGTALLIVFISFGLASSVHGDSQPEVPGSREMMVLKEKVAERTENHVACRAPPDTPQFANALKRAN